MSYFLFLSVLFHFGYLVQKNEQNPLPHNFSIRSEQDMTNSNDRKKEKRVVHTQYALKLLAGKTLQNNSMFFHVCDVGAVVVFAIAFVVILID